jgi:shikimate kinase
VAADAPIWLVGMMGVGKSAVGRALAYKLDLPFTDSDGEVERREGLPIREIFDRSGEARFRALESDVIGELATEARVVALGGGAAVQPGAVERLKRSGVLVYLRARPETLLRRIGDASHRPLLRGLDRKALMERIVALQHARESSYAQAEMAVDTDGRSIGDIATEIKERIAGLDRTADEGLAR